MKRKLLKCFAFLLSIFALMHLYYAYTGDFRVSHLMTTQQKDLKEHQEIPAQKYHYLGHGNQTYAFLSADQKQVLKLFKNDYLLRTWWSKLVPPIPPFRQLVLHQGETKEFRKHRLLNGYRAAYEHDKKNSALIAYHEMEGPAEVNVVLVDGLSFEHPIDLNQYVFALQEKVTTTRQELSKLLAEGKVEETKIRLHQLIDLYLTSFLHGIHDEDHNLIDNTGFLHDRAIRQDVGKVVWNPEIINPKFIKDDLSKMIQKRLEPWLNRSYPAYSKELIDDLEKYVSSVLF